MDSIAFDSICYIGLLLFSYYDNHSVLCKGKMKEREK